MAQNPHRRFENILKPREDKRHYLGLELENKLKVLLISDPETDISAASLTVHVGSMSDPLELQGLPHFLEHMLFMGTKKVISLLTCSVCSTTKTPHNSSTQRKMNIPNF